MAASRPRIYCNVYGCLNSTVSRPTLSFFQLPVDAERTPDYLMMAASRTRTYCIVYGCLNSTLIKPTLSFFRLPPDAERRTEWLRLISREDLLDKSPKSHRVCEEHFSKCDILPGTVRKKLKNIALPSLNLPNLQNEMKRNVPTKILNKDVKRRNLLANKNTQTEQTDIITYKADKNIQTPAHLVSTLDTPRIRKLKSDLLECRKKIKLHEIGVQNGKVQKDTFHKLSDKFLSKELATLVKAQTKLKFHHKGNRYSRDYITFCLNLHNTSPEAYRLLQSTLCMPCPSTLSHLYSEHNTTKINEREHKADVDNEVLTLEHKTETEIERLTLEVKTEVESMEQEDEKELERELETELENEIERELEKELERDLEIETEYESMDQEDETLMFEIKTEVESIKQEDETVFDIKTEVEEEEIVTKELTQFGFTT